MKITFQPNGAAQGAQPVVLVDNSAIPRHAGRIEQWPGDATIEEEKGYGADFETVYARGNAGADLVFTDDCSYPNYAAVITALAAAYNLLKQATQQGTLVVTLIPGAPTLTFANATLRSAKPDLINGVQLILRYTFKVTTLTTP